MEQPLRYGKIEPTLLEKMTFLDLGKKTFNELVDDLVWAKNERLRYKARDAKRREERKAAKASKTPAPAQEETRPALTD